MLPAPAAGEAAQIGVTEYIPGSLLLVTYTDDPEWSHERLLCYPASDVAYYFLTADENLYEESLEIIPATS